MANTLKKGAAQLKGLAGTAEEKEPAEVRKGKGADADRKSTRLNSSH